MIFIPVFLDILQLIEHPYAFLIIRPSHSIHILKFLFLSKILKSQNSMAIFIFGNRIYGVLKILEYKDDF